MTSEFDKLRCIWEKTRTDQSLVALTTWLFSICVEQANKAKDGWNFEKWKEMRPEIFKIYSEDWQHKWEFLDDCHSVLDHQGIEAFDGQTIKLINVVYNAVEGWRDVYDVDKLKKRFPDLLKYLTMLGYKPQDKKGWMWTRT